jgi:phage protein D
VVLSCRCRWQGEPLVYKGVYTVDEVAIQGRRTGWRSPPAAQIFGTFNVKREVSWHDVTVERIVSAIARRYKLTPVFPSS